MATERAPSFLVHNAGDSVAVATRDLSPGQVEGGYLVGPESFVVELREPVPLGHKFALCDLSEGDAVVEYGAQVALASKAIATGEYVHVHNVRSVRWQTSVAS